MGEPAHRNFMDLPAELRLLVFSHAWENKLYKFTIAPLPPQSFICAWPKVIIKTSASDERERPRCKGLPLWLLTCKQTMKEGLSVFSEMYCFRADFDDDRSVAHNQNSYIHASKSMYINDLVVPRINTLVIHRAYVCSHTGTPSTASADVGYKPEPDVKDHLDPVQAQFWLARPGLKDTDPRKMYYVRVREIARDMLKTLLRRRAPVREIRIVCEYRCWGECCDKRFIAWRRMISFGDEVPKSEGVFPEMEGIFMRDPCWKVDVLNNVNYFGMQPVLGSCGREALHLRWRVAYEE